MFKEWMLPTSSMLNSKSFNLNTADIVTLVVIINWIINQNINSLV